MSWSPDTAGTSAGEPPAAGAGEPAAPGAGELPAAGTRSGASGIGAAAAVDIAAALGVTLVGCTEIAGSGELSVPGSRTAFLLVLVLGAAVGLTRRRPSAALTLLWALAALQLIAGLPLLLTELAVSWVCFGTARWGSRATLQVSALSIPAGVLVTTVVAARRGIEHVFLLASLVGNTTLRDTARLLHTSNGGGMFNSVLVAYAVTGGALLAVPWLIGLSVRLSVGARESQRRQHVAEQDAVRAQEESEQARQIARLQEDQARLTRDVHDVVGHSLTVILAQAQSSQFLEDDTEELRRVMNTISESARSALQDVRRVLTPSRTLPAPDHADLERLVQGVRDSGVTVVSAETGRPRPLPPELGTVVHRVLQEMLTNALRHGARDRPVEVGRHWGDELWIEVRNAVRRPGSAPATAEAEAPESPSVTPSTFTGQGLRGMRRRVESVGGRMTVHREQDPKRAEEVFVVTAWIPTRDVRGMMNPDDRG